MLLVCADQAGCEIPTAVAGYYLRRQTSTRYRC